MSLPAPERGLVIADAYLWHSEHQQGREEGGDWLSPPRGGLPRRQRDGAVPDTGVNKPTYAAVLPPLAISATVRRQNVADLQQQRQVVMVRYAGGSSTRDILVSKVPAASDNPG